MIMFLRFIYNVTDYLSSGDDDFEESPANLKKRLRPSSARRVNASLPFISKDPPSEIKLKNENFRLKIKLAAMKKKANLYRRKFIRLKKKNCKIKSGVTSLKTQLKVKEKHCDLLQKRSSGVEILLKVPQEKKKIVSKEYESKEKSTRGRYDIALKAFALTLFYYSPKAYAYARAKFEITLPPPRTLRKWYQTIIDRQGFTGDAFDQIFNILKDNLKSQKKKAVKSGDDPSIMDKDPETSAVDEDPEPSAVDEDIEPSAVDQDPESSTVDQDVEVPLEYDD